MNLKNAKKILIIRLSSLGDILLSTPLIRTLKLNYSPVQIDFLLKTQYKDTIINNPYISNLRLYENNKKKEKDLVRTLVEESYDLAIDLQHNRRSAQVLSNLKCEIVKFNKLTLQKILLVRFKINKLKNAPGIPVRYAGTLDNFTLDDKGLDLFTKNTPSPLLNYKLKYIGLAPGSRHFTKMYPSNYFVDLGRMLTDAGFKVVIFGGQSDKTICKSIASQIYGCINLCNDNNLLQTAADMKKCSSIVCNDSGLMHVACALGVPVLPIFGSTVKEFGFTPYKNKNLILENNSLSCRPCSHVGRARCPKKHFKCMIDIQPHMVFKALKNLISL